MKPVQIWVRGVGGGGGVEGDVTDLCHCPLCVLGCNKEIPPKDQKINCQKRWLMAHPAISHCSHLLLKM